MGQIQYKNNNVDTNVVLTSSLGKNGMNYTGIEVIYLEKGQKYSHFALENRELCVVILSGYVDICLAEKNYFNIGNRMSVFEDTIPYAIYVSCQDHYSITANTKVSIAICEGLSQGNYPSRLLVPQAKYIHYRGHGTMQRIARDILPESEDADSLLIVEVITKGGNWSSFPSHRHDQDDLPNQSLLEEIYYHKLSSEKGFALQGIYDDNRNIKEGYLIQDDCLVLVKEGYHPVSVPEGVDNYYLNVMAGPHRTWVFYNDPYFEQLIKKEEK